MLYMQVSVCPSVCLSGCLSVCPSANYSHISWHIYSRGVSIESLCLEKDFKTIWKQIHAQEKKFRAKKFVLFQSPLFVVGAYDFWWFVCPLTTFLFLGRIAWQWYYWNPCTKGKVLRPISGKWMHKNQFKCKKVIIIVASMLYMQVSVCPSVCLSICLCVSLIVRQPVCLLFERSRPHNGKKVPDPGNSV